MDWNDDFWSTGKVGTDGWLLYDVTGSLSNFSNLSLVSVDWLDSNSTALSTSRSGSDFALFQDGNDIYVTYAIPEPGTLVLFGIAGLAGICTMRRHRRS
ncbi:MAG: PEP-CTERM sorting domain-containing protein [Kiritimatiellae bacterium]|nr:PEP-CTERM sorting domain-containing protein [Kiritimatiellia bacterium]